MFQDKCHTEPLRFLARSLLLACMPPWISSREYVQQPFSKRFSHCFDPDAITRKLSSIRTAFILVEPSLCQDMFFPAKFYLLLSFLDSPYSSYLIVTTARSILQVYLKALFCPYCPMLFRCYFIAVIKIVIVPGGRFVLHLLPYVFFLQDPASSAALSVG